MKVAFLGPGWPWRGGIAKFITLMAEEAAHEHEVKIFSFISQYPKIIFPGKEQLDRSETKTDISTLPVVTPYNPFTWNGAVKAIINWQPEILVFKYWIPFFAPAFGYIIRKLKKKSDLKIVYIIDNIDFHEKWAFANNLTKYAIGKADKIICMSESVLQSTQKILPKSNLILGFHPTYNCYNNQKYCGKTAKKELKIEDKKVILFFGYIKQYKGLTLLLKSMPILLKTDPNFHLLIVGEVYGDDQVYLDLISELKLEQDITFVRRFVADEEVELYFKAADVLVLPYITATQSGVVQVAYDMDLGAVCTPVGGLPELVLDNITGVVAKEVSEISIAEAVIKYFTLNQTKIKQSIRVENKRYTWSELMKLVYKN